jgi:hypothetical protein
MVVYGYWDAKSGMGKRETIGFWIAFHLGGNFSNEGTV